MAVRIEKGAAETTVFVASAAQIFYAKGKNIHRIIINAVMYRKRFGSNIPHEKRVREASDSL